MEETEDVPAAPGADNPKGNATARKRALWALSLVFIVAGAAYGAYWYVYGRWHESTDDAYVAGHVVPVTPQVGGTVLAVHVEDTDTVAAGALLVELDHADYRVALDQAEAALAQTVREVRALYANQATLSAQIRLREVEVARWQQDIARREGIARTGAVTLEEIDHARDALKGAEAALAAAREQLATSRAQTAGVDIEDFPGVLRAAAYVEEAWLALARTKVVAPVAGQVARRNVQVGQRVPPGAPLMAVAQLDRLWVDANFKEVQLRRMHIGDDAKVVADVYGSRVVYHGKIVGLGAGTGAAFSLLPAQNATGNWIKIVQRVPVRIALDPKEIAAHPLRIGLSMQVEVDTREGGGQPLTTASRAETQRFAPADAVIAEARARARAIIRRNLAAAKG